MTNLIEQLNQISKEEISKNDIVKNEIVGFFKEQIEAGKLSNYILNKAKTDSVIAANRCTSVKINFWDYNPGCSDTYFCVGNIRWENKGTSGYESTRYKGVELCKVHKEICKEIQDVVVNYLKSVGFIVHYIEDKEGWLEFYDKNINISW